MKIIELFAGLGSQTQALVNLGVKHEVTAISEIDKYTVQSYTALHGEPNNLGDITKIESLPSADLWTYSFPCQDISLAGKQAGIKEGTRSGLLYEVERLLNVANENDNLPKYLLLENVKPLVGKKFKPDFDKWLSFLEGLGYKNYWQVLNTRDYCIPQNRERVFCVSIRGEHESYRFPEKRELKLRLKDMLDATVDEKYYLSQASIDSLLRATYNTERTRLQDPNGIHRTCCSRDHKSPTVVPSCIQAGNLAGGKWDKMHDISKRVYDPSGISPTLHCAGGGNTEPKIVDDTYKSREPRVYSEVAPSIRSEQHNFKVVAGQFQPTNRDYKTDGEERKEQFECRRDEVSNAVLTGDKKNCIKIVAMRGRLDETGERFTQKLEPSDNDFTNTLTSATKDNLVLESPQVLKEQRTEEGKAMRKECEAGEVPGYRKTMREHVPRTDGVTNTLTTVHKDNLVVESNTFVERGYKDFAEKNGYLPEMFNPYNRAEITEEAPTVTTQCGSTTSSASVLKAETDEVSKCIRVGGRGVHKNHTWDTVEVNEPKVWGSMQANAGVKSDGVCTALTEAMGKGGGQIPMHDYNVRIRKLTPWECLRLQGWKDCEIEKIRNAGISNTQAYRQAGNGITTTVLMAIFGELFGVPYKEFLDEWRY